MIKLLFAGLLALAFTHVVQAQATKITVKIAAPLAFNGNVRIYDPQEQFDPSKKAGGLILDAQQSATRVLPTNPAHDVLLTISFSSPGSKYADHYLMFPLFIRPGDDLTFTTDLTKKNNGVVVTGKGSQNNQPEIAELTNIYAATFTRDTSAYHAIAAINKQQKLNEKILANYIVKYKPSADFIRNSRVNLAYYSATSFYSLKTSTLDYSRNFGGWQHIQDSLFAPIKINNDEGLTAYNYRAFITDLLLRSKEKSWDELRIKPTAFFKEWYNTDVTQGKPLFANQRKNLFIEKVINKNFSGKTAEFLYAGLLTQNLAESNIENIGLLFEHFKQRYPTSKYIAWFSGPVDVVTQAQINTALNNKMVFVADNGSKLNSIKDVLALTKGKTVLVDMWGTWCGPCRQDIENNSKALHAYFKDKDITFLYIANMDDDHEQEWKKLIAYFGLEGTHILANKKLTDDIMAKVKGTGFPTYVLIKKDGTFALTKTQYPFNRQAAITEIDEAIAMK